jgi:adenylosuccinate lyase
MGRLWEVENRFAKMLEVEIAVAESQAELGLIPKEAAKAIRKKSKFNVARIAEIELETKHDVIAFVSNVAENVGTYGRFVHFGMTSSDVLDTAMSLQVREAGRVLLTTLKGLEKALSSLAKAEAGTLCAGRTHGMFAEPTTFGLKVAGFLAELRRHRDRVNSALEGMMICKLSGAVGTYSSQPPEIEAKVAKKLELQTETIATQVIPRDRHAALLMALALLGAGFERLAVELRHLQRSEVGEVIEGFQKGQKGSSAMPHKKNPITAENVTGLARLLRSYAFASVENVALWHERDISHSSVERVVFPDAFIVADYAAFRLTQLLNGLSIQRERMLENIDRAQGTLFSSHVLLALVDKGLSREEAYKVVQKHSHALRQGEHLRESLLNDPETRKLLKAKELDEIFSGQRHTKMIKQMIERVLAKN